MKYYRYSMNMTFLNIACICLFIPFYILICFLGYSSYVDLSLFILYFLWMFVHEFLHGIGFSLGKGVEHKNIVYGANLEKGVFYCMCKQLIHKKDIMVSLLFPFFFIGIVTLIMGFIFSIPILIILSLFNIAGCVGDIFMFLAFLKLPDFDYIDLDDCTGFVLVSKNDLSKYKLSGLNLIESGDYKKLGKANDYSKFTISKLSYIIFILMIVILFVDFFV